MHKLITNHRVKPSGTQDLTLKLLFDENRLCCQNAKIRSSILPHHNTANDTSPQHCQWQKIV